MSRIVVGGLVFCLRFPVGAWILGRMQFGIVNIVYSFSRYTQEILNLYFPEFRLEIWFIFQILLIDLFLKSFWWRVENFIDSSIYLLELLSKTNMVYNFKIFLISFNRNIINILPAVSVDSKISRTLEMMMALKASSFHFLMQYIFIQKISNLWNMVIIIEIFFLILYLKSIYCVTDIPKYGVSSENFLDFLFWKLIYFWQLYTIK